LFAVEQGLGLVESIYLENTIPKQGQRAALETSIGLEILRVQEENGMLAYAS